MSRCCPDHPSYKTAHPPRGDCITCWAAYGRRQAIALGLRGQGRARGGGRSSKKKGRSAALLVGAMVEAGLGLQPGDVLVKATSQGGVDIHLSPAALQRFPYSIEVKNAESLNVWSAMAQAAANATEGRPAVLFFKRANSPLYVAMAADTFLSVRRLLLCPELTRSNT